jgi:uncharacterized protein
MRELTELREFRIKIRCYLSGILRKRRPNRRKHGVTFSEATEVFDDPFNITEFDEDSSINEDRFSILGSSRTALLQVIYTERHGAIRLISARRASNSERKTYHSQTT